MLWKLFINNDNDGDDDGNDDNDGGVVDDSGDINNVKRTQDFN